MTNQSGGPASGTAGGVLSGAYPNPLFATNGTTAILGIVTSALAADVVMTNVNQYYDGPSVTITAGKWLFLATVTLSGAAGGATDFTAQIWDGVTSFISGQTTNGAALFNASLSLAIVATIGAPSTVRCSVANARGGGSIRAAAPNNPVGNTASNILALRIG